MSFEDRKQFFTWPSWSWSQAFLTKCHCSHQEGVVWCEILLWGVEPEFYILQNKNCSSNLIWFDLHSSLVFRFKLKNLCARHFLKVGGWCLRGLRACLSLSIDTTFHVFLRNIGEKFQNISKRILWIMKPKQGSSRYLEKGNLRQVNACPVMPEQSWGAKKFCPGQVWPLFTRVPLWHWLPSA